MSLLDDVSIVVTPNGYKAGELYAVVPVPTEGAEEVTNGDFATDSDWTIGGTTFSAGAILLDDANDNVFQGWTDTVNTLYKLTITKTGLGTLRFRSGFAGSAATKIEIPASGIIYFTSTSDTNRFQIYGDENSINATLNSVSVKEYTSADMDVTRATAATRVDENGLVNYAEIIGSELAICGDFECASPLTGWTDNAPIGEISIDSGRLKVLNLTNRGRSYRTYTGLTIGKTYEAFVGNTGGAGGFTHIVSGTANNNITLNAPFFFVAGATTAAFQCGVNSTGIGQFTYFDNISLKENTRDNVPRIDYTGGGCPHILAEPQRTNLITYSEDFSDSSWTKTGSVSVSSNSVISPDGTLNGSTITGLTGSGSNDLRFITGLNPASTTYTSSVYLKGSGTIKMKISNNVDNSGNTTITLTSSWVRYDLTHTFNATTGSLGLTLDDSGGATATTYDIWGAQLEEGSYATSYIPTSGSTVTRNQDIFTRDGIGSLINSTEGVLFVEMAALSDDGVAKYLTMNDGSSNNDVRIYFNTASNGISALLKSGTGATQAFLSYTVTDTTEFHKIAFVYAVNRFELWVDGEKRAEDLSGVAPVGLNTLEFSRASNFLPLFAKVKQLQVYNTALTDTQLAALTS